MPRLLGFVLFFYSIQSVAQTSGVDLKCSEDNFWSIDYNGAILRWNLSQDSISFDDTVATASPILSLAYCDTFNTATVPRTFYGSNYNNSDSIYYYDGSNWISLSTHLNFRVANTAGYRSHLYFNGNNNINSSSFLNDLSRFDGTQLTSIVSVNPNYFSFADFAVDASGNAWLVHGSSISYSDSILAIAPDGSRLRSFAFSQNTSNGYGSFMLGGVLYLAFGSGNPVYPNSLLKMNFAGNSAMIESVIPFPNSDFIDLASCNPGLPIILSNNMSIQEKNFSISPNPFDSEIRFFGIAGNRIDHLIICDQFGKKIIDEKNTDFTSAINLSFLTEGIYIVTIQFGNKSFVEKLIKISGDK